MEAKTKKAFVDSNLGKDKLLGRPIKLNHKTLQSTKDRNYAEILFFGDLHHGHPQSQTKKAKDMLDYALEHKIYIFCMGDMIEAGLSTSIGDSVYMQKLNPQQQMEEVIDLLEPLAKANLVIGYLSGNHCARIANATGIDISKIICRQLGVTYLGGAGWTVVSVGNIRYSIYTSHGSGGSRFKHTKLKKVMDQAAWIDSDIIAMGHVHSVASEVIIKQAYNRTKNRIEEKKQYVCLTGSYIAWNGTYAEVQGYPPTKLGSPKAKLMADKKGVHFSF